MTSDRRVFALAARPATMIRSRRLQSRVIASVEGGKKIPIGMPGNRKVCRAKRLSISVAVEGAGRICGLGVTLSMVFLG